MNFHHVVVLIAVLWSLLALTGTAYLFSMLKAVAQEVEKVNILLTVIANKQGATEADVKAALGKK
jgi:hypothetical protein